ncbi:flagellar hook-length control protein FliK [Halanaerobium saccharolyticum]|uniref:Flagellar hook-length control protein FliK n=1 Tax=Halanaerobium saccharolyticum TaxID=43595 RepID=A0A4R7Z974_9FIRM|nr:flagellar hook-length control protein FliK [Halanaerobium saccharolyticum]RAK09410.1 flagellar hook-length control protein FliK [Halanaerobium saccharolyticum]TDW06267.1 flagellar hook-length control protein FliK [Halanaerobium saccharolyticum]TDX61061.1 flagellar hook-length control protein FliK [Halanaerobium saccharolyticum]
MDLSGLAPIRKLDIGMLRQALNTDNISTDESQAKSESAELLPEIFRLLASLEDDSQKMLLDSWAKMEMPLNEKTVANLLQYLGNNPALTAEDKMAVIKAFAFLESNGLPFSEKLVDALRSIFNNNGNLSSTLEQFMTSNNSLSQEQLNNLLSQLNLGELKNSLINIDNFSQQTQGTINQEATASTANLNSETINPESTADTSGGQAAAELASQSGSAQTENNNLNPQILNNFAHLDQEIKNLILNNLNSLSQNFDKNTVKILNNFLANNNIEGSAEKTALLKAFAFLENNQLPLTESLIKETAANFQQNISQFTENLSDKNQVLANLNNADSPLISNNEAAVNLNTSAGEIAESLAAQSKIFDQILALFNKSGGENEEKIADNLLGQKLVNLQQQSQNTPLMLALEIPVRLPDNKLSSLLLKVEKEEGRGAENQANKSGYNISFILEFENIGPIQTKVNVNQKSINTTFFTESAITANLIERNFGRLQSALQGKGFNINSVRIKNFDNLKEEKTQFFNKIILSELNDLEEEGQYRHIDIKI